MASTEITAPQAREMTEAERDEWVAQSFADQQQIKAGLHEARGGLWKAAEALYRFSENGGWLALGYDTLGEWLADPDITMSRRTFFQMTQAWRELIVIRKIPSANVRTLDLTKVSIALPALKAGSVTTEDALSDIEVLPARDLREKYTSIAPVPDLDGTDLTATGDGLPEEPPPTELEPPVMTSVDGYVSRDVAQILFSALLRVMEEIGAPERKAMSNDLRNVVGDALAYAEGQGVAFYG